MQEHADKGRTRSSHLVGAALVFGLSCGVFCATTKLIRQSPAWRTFEFCHYAEIARNLATRGTFATSLAEPMALAYCDQNQISPRSDLWPVVSRYPLPCFVEAASMKLFGPNELAAAWSNGVAIGLLAALTFQWAAQWYGVKAAAIATALFLANPSLYGYFILLGTPDVWFAVFFLLQLRMWLRLLESSADAIALPMFWSMVASAAYLTRFNMLLFMVVELFVLICRRRCRSVFIALGVFTVAITPLAMYNLRHFGRIQVSIYNGWNLLDGIRAFAVEPWLYYQTPDVSSVLRSHLREFLWKWSDNLLNKVPLGVLTLWHWPLMMPLALSGWRFVKSPASAGRFVRWSTGMFSLQLIAFSALRLEFDGMASPHHGRYFFWFCVPALLGAIGIMARIALGQPRFKWLLGLLLIAQFGIYVHRWQDWIRANREPSNIGRDAIRNMVRNRVPDGKIVASNQPQLLAWYGERRALSLPADPEEIAKINRLSPTPIDYLFIDFGGNFIDMDRRWSQLLTPVPGANPWEARILEAYAYLLPPDRTRPLGYVILRRLEGQKAGVRVD